MRNEAEILVKIEELQSQLSGLSEKALEEIYRPRVKGQRRDHRLIFFLYREKAVLEFALAQMKWLFGNEQG